MSILFNHENSSIVEIENYMAQLTREIDHYSTRKAQLEVTLEEALAAQVARITRPAPDMIDMSGRSHHY